MVWFASRSLRSASASSGRQRRPALLESVEQWTRTHARGILLLVSFGAGAALIIRGILSL